MSFQFNSIRLSLNWNSVKRNIQCVICTHYMYYTVQVIYVTIVSFFFVYFVLLEITNEKKNEEPFVWQRIQQLVLFDIPLLNCCSEYFSCKTYKITRHHLFRLIDFIVKCHNMHIYNMSSYFLSFFFSVK